MAKKSVCSDNPGQINWNKIEKSSKIGQDKISLRSIFARFLTASANVKFLERRLGIRLCLHSNLRFL